MNLVEEIRNEKGLFYFDSKKSGLLEVIEKVIDGEVWLNGYIKTKRARRNWFLMDLENFLNFLSRLKNRSIREGNLVFLIPRDLKKVILERNFWNARTHPEFFFGAEEEEGDIAQFSLYLSGITTDNLIQDLRDLRDLSKLREVK